ncbi:MAG: O-antigen ligase family protein [Planctomycetales bacterium]|nr:O-antigen ligase family protein [Planctomycetales bacterium]
MSELIERESVVAEWVGIALVVMLLLGGFVLVVPYILMGALALCCASVGLALMSNGRMDRLAWLVMANYAYWLLSGLFTGGVTPSTLAKLDFWDGEGRVLLYYLPFLPFAVLALGHSPYRTMLRTTQWIVVAGAVVFLAWVGTSGRLFSGHSEGRLFFGLATSHTGAGTFWGSAATLLLVYGITTRKRLCIVLGCVCIVLILGTSSRQTLVGLFAVFLWFVFKERRLKVLLAGALCVCVAMAVLPLLFPHTSERLVRMASVSLPEFQVVGGSRPEFYFRRVGYDDANIEIRFEIWQYACQLFANSPLVGIGFGRFNDTSLDFWGVKRVLYLAFDGVQYISERNDFQGDELASAGNAHNSYLHVLAETGLAGFALLTWLWGALYLRLERYRRADDLLDDAQRAFLLGAQGLIVFSLTGAMFGHALGSPAMGIVVMTACGCALPMCRVRADEQVEYDEELDDSSGYDLRDSFDGPHVEYDDDDLEEEYEEYEEEDDGEDGYGEDLGYEEEYDEVDSDEGPVDRLAGSPDDDEGSRPQHR